MLNGMFGLSSRYQKQARHYLETARLAALEHEVAAEHHAALAAMYRERAVRLEREVEAMSLTRLDPHPGRHISSVK